ncbi:type II toxin-antitoxin system PemK/MazF family toxin [Staphylococcus borealis]|uniref:type II toxin-antitoxin system PemK/MazF family toxin n=1 Tax=Staphylococcus borealis TaxID=2742203 RepID=UPI000FF2C5F8|nr:type II toxin-antitoxin system PemK/MazF family toxin [Staphylococcus borealis]MDM7862773.1 type II toxin-antitoxin system PemK/MazF family toxin [Staphylococcus borealis]MDM7881732.1 type II toxin-antitoxin system PemK/MazF family toxin [Staphylococcus borealis]RIO94956.1 type II toxin-antitoxin system PemK/MazF family toxin [Staphylococcus haemolyticus]
MVSQFDIIKIDLNPVKGIEKGKYRPCLIISNNYINQYTGIIWVMPITSRNKRYPSDIEVKTKLGNISGIIDTVQIQSLDIQYRNYRVVDHLHENLKHKILETIEAHTEPI